MLSASTGSWTGTNPIHYAYQWQRNRATISGASGPTYSLTLSDVGYRIDVVVSASNSVGSRSATSESTPTVTSAGIEPPLPPPPPSAPTVAGLTPKSGPEAGGTTVSIAGSNFSGVTAVKFGATGASSFTVGSTSSMTAVAPSGSGSVDVTVDAAGGSSAVGSSDRFSYVAPTPPPPSAQTITFTSTPPSSATVGGSYTVSATASSGLPVSFSSATPGVCPVSGATVSFATAGTCTIDANQAGNAEWAPAPQVQQSLAISEPPPPPPPPATGFLGKTETAITLGGNPLRLLGYNYSWVGPTCGGPSAAALEIVFPNIVAHSKANIVRVAMYQVYKEGHLDFTADDQYVAYAKHYGLRIVPMLTGNWGDCESGGEKFLSFWKSGYQQAPQSQNEPLSYKEYVEAFVRHYANEPTIAWYQLANEPDGRNPDGSCNESAAASALRSFADTMSGAIKAIDHNHMVDLGAISWCGGQGANYGYVNAGAVDLCDAYHDYTAGAEALSSTFASHIAQCLADKKPAFVGEAGICAYVQSNGSCTTPTTAVTLQNRANDFKAKMEAGFKAGLAGYIIWSTSKGCSGTEGSTLWNVGSNNSNPACLVPEMDPTEPVLAGFAEPPPALATGAGLVKTPLIAGALGFGA